MMKRILSMLVVLILFLQVNNVPVYCETIAGKSAEPPVIKSESVVLTDQKTGKVLYEKDSHKRLYSASITKILTALLIIDNIDLNETITVGKEIDLVAHDASDAGLTIGEKLSGQDLIWALMLPSGNDAAYTAAVAIARKKTGNASMSIQEAVKYFSDMMNKRAQDIGAKESSFVNPDGYPEDNHYSTAYDLALIAGETMKNAHFREVVGTYAYTAKDEASSQSSVKSKKEPPTWYNKNQLINKKSKYYYMYATGIKTGYTSLAGYCLASSASKNEMDLIAIVLKAGKEETRLVDSKNLFEYGFNNFKYHTLLQKGETISSVKVVRKYFGDVKSLDVIADKDFTDILTDSEISGIKKDILWNEKLVLPDENKTGDIKLQGPIKSGQVLGKLSIALNGKTLVESDLIAAGDALKGDFTDKMVGLLDQIIKFRYIILVCTVIAILAVIALTVRGSRRRKS